MKNVIIAEDIRTILEKDHSFLNRFDIRTSAAATNEDILSLHHAKKADLIITNLDMPGMKGEDLCSKIRHHEELRRVSIMIVCADTAVNIQRCIQCRANAFITSPVSSAVLLQEAYQLLQVTPRRSCRIPLKLRMEGRSKKKSFSGHAENISASGMLFHSAAILFEGDAIECSFSLTGSLRISANAEIVRVENGHDTNNRYGVIFADLSAGDIYAIEAFVSSRVKTPAAYQK